MAISGNVYSGKEVQLGIAQEAAFGTAIADAGAFVQIAEFGSISIDYGVFQDLGPKNRGKRISYDADIHTTQTGGLRVITISDIIFRKTDLAEFLYAVFQSVTEAAATPYMKTFSVADDQPDYQTNQGYFCTLAIKNPIGGMDEKFTSCICRELDLSVDLVGGDGRLRGNATFISGFAASTAQTMSGTWAIATQAYFDAALFDTKTLFTNDIVLYGMTLNINNNATRHGNTSAGNCEGYSIGIPEIAITGTVNYKYDPNVQALLANYLAGTEGVIEIGYDTGTPADGDVVFDINEAQIVGYERDDDRAEGVARTLNFKGVATAAATPEVRVADAVDQAW